MTDVKQEQDIVSPQRTSLVSMTVGFCVCWDHLKQPARTHFTCMGVFVQACMRMCDLVCSLDSVYTPFDLVLIFN